MQTVKLQLLQQDPAMTMDDSLGQSGRPRGVDHPQRMVEQMISRERVLT